MNPHETALTALISLARRRGRLSMEDLRRTLPVDSMTVEDLSHVLARLDQAGCDLEIDPTLLSPKNESAEKSAAPIVKRDETDLPEPVPEGRQQQTSPPASAVTPVLKSNAAGRSDSLASASMLPWILAFAIVVIAAFAAFAF